eukprot:28780_1
MSYASKRKINKTNKIYFQEAVNQIKYHLITIEEKNTEIRRKELELFINEETENVNKQIFGKHYKNNNIKFRYTINDIKMKKFLDYIYQWNGLSSSAKIPKTIKEYQDKARNWLNGRRAKNYGNSLYVDMINNSLEYARSIANNWFISMKTNEIELRKLIYNALVCSYLTNLCAKRISLNQSAKKSYLLSEHSIKSKSKTKLLLQQYSTKSLYSSTFPAHRREAIDHFQKQYQSTLNIIHHKLNPINININKPQIKPKIKPKPIPKFIDDEIIENMLIGNNINVNNLRNVN